MESRYGKFFLVAERISNLVFLNLLWIISCLPILTISPATAAMFAVFREWVTKKETGIFRIFMVKFKENFKQSMSLQLVWIVYTAVSLANLKLINDLGGVFRTVLLASLLAVGILLFLISIYMFTLMVHYELSTQMLWKNAFLISLTSFPISFLTLILTGSALTLAWHFPLLLTFLFSGTGYILFRVCFGAWHRPNYVE